MDDEASSMTGRSLPGFVWPLSAVFVSWLLAVRGSQHPYVSIDVLLTMLGQVAVFIVATRCPVKLRRELCWVWLMVAALVAANGLARLWSEPEFVSTIGNWNFLGAYLAAAIALGVMLRDKRANLICLLLLVALCFCRSRGAWLALATTTVLWLLLGTSGNATTRVLCRMGGLTLVLAAVFLGRSYAIREWRTEVRPLIWESTLRMVAARPLLGHGLGTFVMEYPQFRLPEYFRRSRATNVTDHAHNELLEITAEQGLLGLAATLWLWGAAFSRGIRSLPVSGEERRWGLGILGAATVLLVHGMLDVGVRYPPNQALLWFLLGLMWSGSGRTDDSREPSGTLAASPPIRAGGLMSFARRGAAALCLLGVVWITVAGIVRPLMADVWERRARLAEEGGRLEEAATDARRSLGFQPFRPTVRYFLAGVLARSTDAAARDQAIQECLEIEELFPNYADVTYNLGQLYLLQNQPQRALPYLTRAVEINPYPAERHVALASACAQLGQTNIARAHLGEALRLDPQNQTALRLLAELDQEQAP